MLSRMLLLLDHSNVLLRIVLLRPQHTLHRNFAWLEVVIALHFLLHMGIIFFFFFFHDTAPTELYTLSLHDALPISGCHFSFSGLKAAVKRAIDALPPGSLREQDVFDMAASFQAAVADVIGERTGRAIDEFRKQCPNANTLVVAGGVAANTALRTKLEDVAGAQGMVLAAPPLNLCTDNGAMIAWAGIERLRLDQKDALDFAPRPRWPLDPDAPKAAGAGVKA